MEEAEAEPEFGALSFCLFFQSLCITLYLKETPPNYVLAGVQNLHPDYVSLLIVLEPDVLIYLIGIRYRTLLEENVENIGLGSYLIFITSKSQKELKNVTQ
nr:hypothetical protein [Thermococcus henrietii]